MRLRSGDMFRPWIVVGLIAAALLSPRAAVAQTVIPGEQPAPTTRALSKSLDLAYEYWQDRHVELPPRSVIQVFVVERAALEQVTHASTWAAATQRVPAWGHGDYSYRPTVWITDELWSFTKYVPDQLWALPHPLYNPWWVRALYYSTNMRMFAYGVFHETGHLGGKTHDSPDAVMRLTPNDMYDYRLMPFSIRKAWPLPPRVDEDRTQWTHKRIKHFDTKG